MSLVTGALALALTAAPLVALGPSGEAAAATQSAAATAPAATTPSPTTTAPPVSGLAAKAAGATSASVTWSAPTDPAVAAVVISRADATHAARDIYTGTGTSVTDTGLVPGVEYTYTARPQDTSGNVGPVSDTVRLKTNRTWTTAVASPYAGWPAALACATTTWCMVVNNTGTFQVMSGSTWSAPVAAFAAGAYPDRPGSIVTSLTCPAPGRCLAIRANTIVEFNGVGWRSAGSPSSGWRAVDCPTTTYCVAIRGDGWSTTRVGTTWRTPVRIGTLRGVEWWDVGCQAAARCFAVATGNATYSSWRGTLTSTWSTAYLGSYSQGNAYRISCSTTACLGLGDRVRVTVSGTTWTLQTLGVHDPDDWTNELSCGTPSLCLALNYGNVARWSTTALLDRTRLSAGIGTMAAVSCPRSGGACFAIDNRGRFYRWTPTARWVLVATLHTSGGVGRVGCLSTTSCFLFDGNGWLVTWNGATWTRSGKLFTQPATVECSGAGFCIAVDRTNKAYRVWARGAWGAAKSMPLAASDLSCASPTLCLAVDAEGRASRFDGTGWQAPVAVLKDPYADGPALSCAPAGPCMLASSDGSYRRFVGTTFTTAAKFPSGLPVEDKELSCATASSCLVAVQNGSWAQWNGSAWTLHVTDSSPFRFGALTCLTATHCLATHPYSNDWSPMAWNSGTWSDDGTYAPNEIPFAPECPTMATCFVAGGTNVSRSG